MKRVLLFPFSQLDATALAQCDGMSKQSTILSPDYTTGQAPAGHWCFSVWCFLLLYQGKTNTTFCWQEHSGIWSRLRAAGEEFLKSPWQLHTNN